MTLSDRAGCQALDHLDKALAERPQKNGHELSAALRCLAEFRDHLVAARRRDVGGAADSLIEPVNAVISSVLAAQFPLGDIPWEELEKARAWLADAVENCQAEARR
jgi:hypothetical protein